MIELSIPVQIERLSTGVPDIDRMIGGGIPRGFFVAVTGEPGTGKTILCIHFMAEGIRAKDICIYVTTEESRQSIIKQASQFGVDFGKSIEDGKIIIIDSLMGMDEQWSLKRLDMEELVKEIIEAKKTLGYGRARVCIDSLSAFWLDRPAMARRYSYFVKKVLAKWDFTVLITSQYAITTSDAFGFGVEHIADGIIRFRRSVRNGVLRRYLLIEKMRQTPHSLNLHEISILDGKGIVVRWPVQERKEDVGLPRDVTERIIEVQKNKEAELP
ncbi:MAG: KaiC domain-containing protein [Thermoproteota archaeon]